MPIVLEPPIRGLVGGSDVSEVGTSHAIPTGIEAILEYGGIQFNNISTVDKIRVTDIGGLDDADVRDSREVNPAYHGETAFDSYYGGRTITLTGRIEAYNLEKMRDMQMGLRQAFSNLVDQPLIFRSYDGQRDVFINCRKSAAIAMRETQTDWRFFRDFMITLRASNPRFLGYIRQFSNTSFSFTNNGTVIVTPINYGAFRAQPLIRIYGGVSNPKVVNLANNEFIKLNGNIAAGTYIDVDIQERKLVDNTGANRFSMLDLTSDWLELETGPNAIEIHMSGTLGGAPSLEIAFRDTWL